MPEPGAGAASPQVTARHFKRLMTGSAPGGGTGGAFESAGGAEIDLSDKAIADRIATTRAELRSIVKAHLGDDPALYEIADKIAADAKDALGAIARQDDTAPVAPNILNALEVIVRTDGSRPSFMVRDGDPDRSTSPVGNWASTLDDSKLLLGQAIQCVGRIDDPSGAQGFQGTGILIGQNVILTNRHVLQAVAAAQPDKSWKLKPGIAVDFGHEFRARESIGRRKVTGVLFAGASKIDPMAIDHAKLDLALLALEPAAEQLAALALDISPDWGQVESGIFICGFPGNPGFAEAPSLLEQLFRSTFGCKRLAPGLVTNAAATMAASPRHWTLGHDATTLGGNSGSAVLVIGREKVVAGLHYGGRRTDPRENWCHLLGLTLDEPDFASGKPLREVLAGQGVSLVDRLG